MRVQILLILGILLSSLSVQASFFSPAASPSETFVVALYSAIDNVTFDVVVPPITTSSDLCFNSTYYATMFGVPVLQNFFKISSSSKGIYSFSFGCSDDACTNCSIQGTYDANDLPPQVGDAHFLRIFDINGGTLTTFIFSEETCSAFVWPSTPQVTSSGECARTKYFDADLKSSYFMVNILENSTFSIAAHCDKTCQICDYGAIGELFPQQGANNCSNIVIQQLVNETATFYVEAKIGGTKPWSKGRIVTVGIGVGAAAILVLISVAIIWRAYRAQGYSRIN